MDDERSYIMIVEEFSNLVYRIAYQNLMNVADAEDAVQEVFLKLLQHKGEFTDKEHVKAWLLRVAVNQCRDARRRQFRKRESSYASLEQFDKEVPMQEEAYVLSELQKLPETDRNIVYLHYYEGYSLRDIASIIGKSPNAVNVRLVRARKKLKDILEEGFV
ncbi:MAG: sigma-70 family RNA polymerase sigma factor [Lachnospiraceae bacterium]|nr:sigma-70 family RNA polymerase sigma factor [Lachnospiraceae bacterium]